MKYDELLTEETTSRTLNSLDLLHPVKGLPTDRPLTMSQIMSICEQQNLEADLQRMFTRTLSYEVTQLMPLQAIGVDDELRTHSKPFRQTLYLTKKQPGAKVKTVRLSQQPDLLVLLRTDTVMQLKFELTPQGALTTREEFYKVIAAVNPILNFDHICETTLFTQESVKGYHKLTHKDCKVLALRYNNLRLWLWLTYVNTPEELIIADPSISQAPRQYRTQRITRAMKKQGRELTWT